MDASQVRILGLLLLRHLDQDELDRMAKRWKPLRYRYDTAVDGNSSTPSASSSTLDLNQQQQRPQTFPGDVSRLARIKGLQMLLLEESIQHHIIMKQQLSTKLLTGTTDSRVASPEENGGSSVSAATKSAIEKRLPYVELLQQQVQDMVQSIDTVPYSLTAAGPSDSTIEATRDEQLAILHLVCHLVAFSIEHQDSSQLDQSRFAQRLAILAQAIGRLTMGDEVSPQPPRQPVEGRKGSDLLTLDTDTATPVKETSNSNRDVVRSKVSRDVVDQAQLIHSLFLRPLLDSIASTTTELPPLPATTQSLDSPFFKTEKYRQLVRQKLTDQFGVQPKTTAPSADQDLSAPPIDMARLLHYDWRFQIGFNTLAALR